jgi:hypothetical protein
MDRQNASLSTMGAILADTNQQVGWIEADMARLLAVTERDLPTIVENLALACEKLAGISQLQANPRATEADEFFRAGTRALAAAAAMTRKGSRGLSDRWLDEAEKDLDRATSVFRQVPDFWYNLGLARASRGSASGAADAFEMCARYAIPGDPEADRPGLAAQAVLLAAAHLQRAGDNTKARDVIHDYLPLLSRCDELYLTLAIQYGETSQLTTAFQIAPLAAASVQAKIDEYQQTAASPDAPDDIRREASAAAARLGEAAQGAAAEVCRDEGGPVIRLRGLESAVQAVLDAGAGTGLDFSTDGFTPAVLPAEPGIAALLFAEVRIHQTIRQAKAITIAVRTALGELTTATSARQQAIQAVKMTGPQRIQAATESTQRARPGGEVYYDYLRVFGNADAATNAYRQDVDAANATPVDLAAPASEVAFAMRVPWPREAKIKSQQALWLAALKSREAEGAINAELDKVEKAYDAARNAADQAAASMATVLPNLEMAIEAATVPRERIVPGTGR